MNPQQMKRILIVMAMRAEAKPLTEDLHLHSSKTYSDSLLPLEQYLGKFGRHLEVLVSVNGISPLHGADWIGTDLAILNAYLTGKAFKPDLILSVGTAGGFKSRSGQIGDVYLSEGPIKFHDRIIPIPRYHELGIGNLPSADARQIAAALGLKLGVVSTGNSFTAFAEDLRNLEEQKASVKEMEAGSVATAAFLLKTPFIALKSITDLVDGGAKTEEEFLRNLERASRILREKTEALLDWCDQHPEFLGKT